MMGSLCSADVTLVRSGPVGLVVPVGPVGRFRSVWSVRFRPVGLVPVGPVPVGPVPVGPVPVGPVPVGLVPVGLVPVGPVPVGPVPVGPVPVGQNKKTTITSAPSGLASISLQF